MLSVFSSAWQLSSMISFFFFRGVLSAARFVHIHTYTHTHNQQTILSTLVHRAKRRENIRTYVRTYLEIEDPMLGWKMELQASLQGESQAAYLPSAALLLDMTVAQCIAAAALLLLRLLLAILLLLQVAELTHASCQFFLCWVYI